MVYKCGSCNEEFDNLKAQVEHMVEKHNSPFTEGDEKLIRMSINHAVKTKNTKVLGKLQELGVINEKNERIVY